MRRIRSFFAALCLLVILMGIVHVFCKAAPLKDDHRRFGLWYNMYKNLSYEALSVNMEDTTVPVMGSSEFRHDRGTKFHLAKVFADSDADIMIIGGPYNQTLYHTVALGSLEPGLKSKKAVLLLSPTWFKKDGVKKSDYALRFSETEYIKFMENPDIPDEIKNHVAVRSEELLSEDANLRDRVSLIDSRLVYGMDDPFTNARFRIESLMASDRDHLNTRLFMSLRQFRDRRAAARHVAEDGAAAADGSSNTGNNAAGRELTDEYWADLAEDAIRWTGKHSNNPFGMKDSKWKAIFAGIYESSRGRNPNNVNPKSRELEDLETFLELCRACDIEAKLIILPVNGGWYDYVGTTQAKRAATVEAIAELGEKYGAEITNLGEYDYEEAMTMDAVHPWHKGWVIIDEEIYDFVKK